MKLLREPLVYFLLAGAVVFAVDRLDSGSADDNVIEVTSAQLKRMSDQWQAQMGRPPTEQELAGLTEQWIREEIYYREARNMGLDENDVIIRRRLAQKLTFLIEDLADAEATDPAALEAYYEANPGKYTRPEQFSFEHRYFSSERHADAEAAARLALDNEDATGDPFMLQRSYAARSQREIRDLFGREFAASLALLDAGADWQGPLRSAYGWHLVQLKARTPEQLRPLDEVRRDVAADLAVARRREANQARYEDLQERYEIRNTAGAMAP